MHVHSFLPVVGLTLFPLVFSASLPPYGVFRRDSNLTVSNNLPSPWTSQGCYSDSTSNRALPLDQYYDNNGMTEESCIQYCGSKGYSLAGVEYAQECYCGYQLGSSATKQSDSDCNMACTGNAAEPCGGSARMNVFWNGTPPPQTDQGPAGTQYLGCYSDSVSGRGLNTSNPNAGGSSGMTVAACTTSCFSAGFVYAGVEYGRECYCGNAIQNGNSLVGSGCNMVCTGNSSEYCGGASRMNLYQPAAPNGKLYGFESGGSGWSTSPSAAGSASLQVQFASDNTNAHTGKGYVYITSGNQYGATGQRGICITTYNYIDTAGSYSVSLYVGGVNEYHPDPRSNYPPPYSLSYSVSVGGSAAQGGSVCEGNCPYNNVGGSPAYGYGSFRFNVAQGYQNLTICANYDGTRRGGDDLFLLDDVTFAGPY